MRLFIKRIVSLTLIITILASLVTVPAWAYGSSTEKQEVIYINLKGDGSVDNIYVVNIFDLNEEGQIIDYGDYTALRNMTTNDEIRFDNQTVKIDTNARKLYYQGRLNSSVIPWILDICYYINDAKYPADKIAGMSGSLKITMKVRKNPDCSSTFFDHYALQVSFTLDTNSCSNIVAENATQANAGKNRQLMYTILPGKEKDIAITAQVEDFEMDGISINGIPLSLDVDIDVENNEDINELQDGVADLDDGAKELDYAAEKLEDGSGDLVDGITDLRDGVKELKDGANELNDGADVLYDGVRDLDKGAGDLLDGADDLAEGAETLYDGASSMDDGIQTLYDGTKELNDGIDLLADRVNDLESGTRSLESGASDLKSGLSTLTAKNSTIQRMSMKLYSGTLSQHSALLSAKGYIVTEDSTLEELEEMMKRRQAELTEGSAQAEAIREAIETRMAELQDIAENHDTAAQAGLNYWNMTLVLQGMEQYKQALAEALAEAGDDPAAQAAAQAACDAAYEDVLSAYQTMLAPYIEAAGGDTDSAQELLTNDYAALSAQVGDSEQAAVAEIVTEILGGAVAGDEIYNALAVLSYYKGIIDYTKGVASAASGAASLSQGADSLYDGAGELYSGAKALKNGSGDLLDGIQQLMDGTAELKDGTLELHDGVLTIKDGIITLKDGTKGLLDGVTDLKDGTVTLCDGTVSLLDGTVELLDGAIELHDGTIKLHDGTVELADGTLELRDKTSDASLKDKITKAIDEAIGMDFDPVSFVSKQNTKVDLVQFVIKTPDISVEEEEYVQPAPAAPLNFWQKLLSLFGLYHAE
ncbi:MAG: hypothetical protein VB106_09245 [Clostridiaceae bacterium]|nr:hypothetical protein [Clostridiaceae bacterium]